MDTLHDELMIASCLGDIEKGEVFQRWPLHITLVPWFSLSHDQRFELDEALRHIAERTPTFTVIGGEIAHFGPHRRQVRLLGDRALHELHGRLTKVVEHTGGQIISSAHIGEHYRPHITERDEGVEEGEEVRVHGFQLVSKIGPHDNHRKVEALYRFEG
ncbi:MAG: 2'-5' RNA ligase family protein [Candidatus Saccharimonadales bacterium]